jgi:acyl-ACP thioesterase
MNWIHEASFSVRGYEVDTSGFATVSAINSYMEEAAHQHAAKLAYGVARLLSEGKTWVLTREYIEIYRRPTEGGTVLVRTWPVGVGRMLFRRDFELYIPGEDEPMARATTEWAIVNMETRRAERISQQIQDDLTPPEPNMVDLHPTWKIAPQDESPKLMRFRARMADIDRNAHVNNVRYLDWIIESAPQAHDSNKRLASVELLFKAEALYKDIIFAKGMAGENSDEFLHSIAHEDGRELVRARTQWVENS